LASTRRATPYRQSLVSSPEGHLVLAAPRDQESLGDHVRGVRRLLDAPHGVGQERLEVRAVDAPETFLAFDTGAHVHPMSGQARIVTR